jgi:hypothetical protein
MSVQEIEKAISLLDEREFAELTEWLANLEMEKWDAQIARDTRAGKVDAIIARANKAFTEGLCTPL